MTRRRAQGMRALVTAWHATIAAVCYEMGSGSVNMQGVTGVPLDRLVGIALPGPVRPCGERAIEAGASHHDDQRRGEIVRSVASRPCRDQRRGCYRVVPISGRDLPMGKKRRQRTAADARLPTRFETPQASAALPLSPLSIGTSPPAPAERAACFLAANVAIARISLGSPAVESDATQCTSCSRH